MIRPIFMVLLAVLVISCKPVEKSMEIPSAEKEDANLQHEQDVSVPKNSMQETGMNSARVQGLELWMFEKAQVDGREQRPTFWIRAATGEADENMNSTMTNPRSVIYDDDGGEIVLTSKTGYFDQESQRAILRGDVLVVTDGAEFTMSEITWDNDLGSAFTDTGTILKSESAHLEAEGLTINPKTDRIEMRNVTGTIKLGELN